MTAIRKVKKYNIIYADPPWSYNDKMRGHSFSLDKHYKSRDINWIKTLPIQNLTAENTILFLWAVSPLLPEALSVINNWGFKYKTVAFCWSKVTSNKNFVHNLGRWTMGNVELCLLGVKGKPKRICNNIKQIVHAERKEHSRKPAVVRKRIVELCGDLPRIELFARQAAYGWDCWGDEIKYSIPKEVLNDSDT